MKEVCISAICSCGFQVDRVFYTNEYGYFEISNSYCPDCFNILVWNMVTGCPMDIIEVNNANKHRS